jgi:hypothetical protein
LLDIHFGELILALGDGEIITSLSEEVECFFLVFGDTPSMPQS